MVTHKIVSKAEGRYVALADVTPSPPRPGARGGHRQGRGPGRGDPLGVARRVLRFRPGLIIAEHRLGMVLANAGVDQSNVPQDDEPRVLLLPRDPDASSAALRAALRAALWRCPCGGGERQRRAGMAPRRRRARDRRRRTAGAARSARQARPRRPRAPGHSGRPRRRDRLGGAAADGRGRRGAAGRARARAGVAGSPGAGCGAAARARGRTCSDERGGPGGRLVRRHRRRQARARPVPDAAAGLPDGGVQHRRRLRASRAQHLAGSGHGAVHARRASPIPRPAGGARARPGASWRRSRSSAARPGSASATPTWRPTSSARAASPPAKA